MNDLRISSWRAALALSTLGAAALLAACGGGGGGSDNAVVAATPVTYAQGVISGFGSVIINGVRFDDSTATVEDEDGVGHDKSELKLGAMVQVDAGAVTAGTAGASGTAKAERFRLGSEIVGPITSIGATSIVVLGQTVNITASTVFDNSLSGGLAALKLADVIEVHGIVDATTKEITATRIEPKAAALAFRLRGVVSALDTTAKTFKIGTETISYAGLAAAAVPANLANDQVVRVVLNTVKDANGNWVATKLRNGRRAPDLQREAEVEGTISKFDSVTSFELNGLVVDASGAGTSFPQGTAGIVLGARVEVEGAIVNGVLVARKVEVEAERERAEHGGKREVELHGVISSLDGTAKTFSLRSLTVSYANANFVGGTAADLAATTAPTVEVRGVLSSDKTRIEATKVVFEKKN